MTSDESHPDSPAPSGRFATTHWSVVLTAQGHDPSASAALETLCSRYWYPLYAFARRGGLSPADAEDGVQGFFEQLMERSLLSEVDPVRGRFRTFLLACFKHYLAKEVRRRTAIKRGGQERPLSLEELSPEQLYEREVVHSLSPDRLYDRAWARRVLEEAGRQLRFRFARRGQEQRFDVLWQLMAGSDGELTYQEATERLGLAPGSVRAEVFRLKQRYQRLVRSEVANTLDNPAEAEAELEVLMVALRDGEG